MTKAFAFELSDDDRVLLVEALGDYAWRYQARDSAKAERCEQLATQLRSASDEPAPTTERMPRRQSTIPPADVPWFV
jgi:hypothetical protein